MKILIETSENQRQLIVRPIDGKINELTGIGVYIKRLNNGYIDDDCAVIPVLNTDIYSLNNKIKTLFVDRLKCEVETDKKAGELLLKAKQESEKFEEFSKKALSIRNNMIDESELIDFTNTLSKSNFKRTLLPYQLLAAYHISFSQNACNFSVPGSGKTTTVLAAYEYLRNTLNEKKHVDKLLVIGPLAAFIAWKEEYKECFGYEPTVLEIRGGVSNETVENALLQSNVREDLIIASYGSIANKKDILQRFLSINKCMVVLDEAHRIKNVEDGVQSSAALSLSTEAKSRVILTGTPAANSYVDLYNLYKFIWPANDIIGYSKEQLSNMSKTDNDYRVPDLIRRISPFFIRIKKSDLKLPEAKENIDYVEMAPIQSQIYEAIASLLISTLEQNGHLDIFKKSAVMRLRQAATNPSLLAKPLNGSFDCYDESQQLIDNLDVSEDILSLISNYSHNEIPSKFIYAKELAERIIINNGKLLIWCEFIGTCDDLCNYLLNNGIKTRILYGATPQEEREIIVEAFKNPLNIDFNVVIANPHAVGESISLHKGCHNALYLELGFNAGTYMQSKDRIHRVGLNDNDITNYYYIHSIGTSDITVYDRVRIKEKRMLDVIESEEIPLIENNKDFAEDTDDDIKEIIRAYYEFRKQI